MVVEVHLSFWALMLSQLGFGSGEALARFPEEHFVRVGLCPLRWLDRKKICG
jgi:hypothetical protein